MLTRRSVLVMIPGTVLLYGLTARVGRTAPSPVARAWVGEDLRRISPEEQAQLGPALRAFFNQSEGNVVSDALISGVGPLLVDQFAAVDYGFFMEEYQLPSGRLIWDRYDAHSGVDAIVVPTTSASGSLNIAAAALLTHLCPKNGVDETFTIRNGATDREHFRCQLDYSLVIFYAHGATPDPNVNADLTKWAQASIAARAPFRVIRPARKLRLKRFVRVLEN